MNGTQERHTREIEELIAAHQAKADGLEGRAMLRARQELSQAIAAACERHRKELNIPAVTDESADA